MRRGLAGLLFFIAAICLALAAGGWWLQRVAFNTTTSADLATVVLEDDGIRDQVGMVLSDAAASAIGVPAADLYVVVDQVLQSNDPEVRAVLEGVVADSHARLIGTRDEPVQISGEQIVPIVRDQRAAALPPVILPVEEVGVLSTIRTGLGWFVPGAAIAGALALLIGLIAHPRKSDAVFGIGIFCIVGALAMVLLGYVVPVHLFPTLNDNAWAAVIPAVAEHSLPLVVAAALILAALGIVLILGSAAARRRRSWSTPVTVSRYTDQRRWS